MDAEQIAAHFTGADGAYRFARWRRPIVPVVFGADAGTLAVMKGAIEAVVALAGHRMAETDPEMGANLMVFFLRDWEELCEVPDLDRLVEGLPALVERLASTGAEQYRRFLFERDGAIRAAIVLLRLGPGLARLPAGDLCLSQAVQSVLAFSGEAFRDRSALEAAPGDRPAVLRPEIAGLIRAAYDPVLPDHAGDPAHAMRLAARLATAGGAR